VVKTEAELDLQTFVFCAVIFTGSCLGVIWALRGLIIVQYNMRRLLEIKSLAEKLIDEEQPWEWLYKEFEKQPNLNHQTADLTKWTYRQFYPKGLEEKMHRSAP